MKARDRSIAARRANLTRTAAALVVPHLLPAIKEVISNHVAQLDPRELARAGRLASRILARRQAGDRKRVDELLELLDVRIRSLDDVFEAMCAILEPGPFDGGPPVPSLEAMIAKVKEQNARPPAADAGLPRDSKAAAAARAARAARERRGEVGHG